MTNSPTTLIFFILGIACAAGTVEGPDDGDNGDGGSTGWDAGTDDGGGEDTLPEWRLTLEGREDLPPLLDTDGGGDAGDDTGGDGGGLDDTGGDGGGFDGGAPDGGAPDGGADGGDDCTGIEITPDTLRARDDISTQTWYLTVTGCAEGIVVTGSGFTTGPYRYWADIMSMPSEVDGSLKVALVLTGPETSSDPGVSGDIWVYVDSATGDHDLIVVEVR